MNMTIENPRTANSLPMTHVRVLTGEGAQASEIEALVEFASRVVAVPLESRKLKEQLGGEAADLIIANFARLADAEMRALDEIRSLSPNVPLIVVSPQLTSEETRRLFQLDILDWLPKPLAAEDLIDAIKRAMQARKPTGSSVHAVVSASGGVGATTLAISMADLATTRFAGKAASVALFDLDFSLGNCGCTINLMNDFNLGTVAATPRRVDAEFIRVIQKRHHNGFYLYSFKRPEINTGLNGAELVLRMLDAVSLEHDHCFLDIPYYETDWRADVFAAVNDFTLVSELQLPAIKHTLDLVERIKALRGRDVPIAVVFNKHESSLFGQTIGKKRLKELLGETPFYFLPFAKGQIGQAMDRGVLPSDVSKRSAFLKALMRYMKTAQIAVESAS